MARYIARFMKNVLGENGHEVEICQRLIEIEAPCVTDAAELAKMKFCESENVRDWLRIEHAPRNAAQNSLLQSRMTEPAHRQQADIAVGRDRQNGTVNIVAVGRQPLDTRLDAAS